MKPVVSALWKLCAQGVLFCGPSGLRKLKKKSKMENKRVDLLIHILFTRKTTVSVNTYSKGYFNRTYPPFHCSVSDSVIAESLFTDFYLMATEVHNLGYRYTR